MKLLSSILLILAAAGTAFANIQLNQDFDNGSLKISECVVEGDVVRLAGRDNYNPGRWKWIHFEASGVQDRRLRFELGDNFAAGTGRLSELQFVYSYDREEWFFFDHCKLDEESGTYSFENGSPFEHDRVVIAYSLPYPYSRVVDHARRLNESPWVQPTKSGDMDLIIGRSAGGIDCIGRTIPPHDLFGFLITDPTIEEPKTKVSITGGVHANESLANHVLEALIDFLVSEDPRAAEFREKAEVYVYPMVNPDGRFAGYNRGGVQHERRDTNRFWHEDLYQDMTEIRAVAEALLRDTGGEVTWHFDFHSWTDTKPHFTFLNGEVLKTNFWRSLTEREPDMKHTVSDSDARTGRWFGLHRLHAKYTLTPETMFRPGENLERYRRMGRSFALALCEEVLTPEAVLAE